MSLGSSQLAANLLCWPSERAFGAGSLRRMRTPRNARNLHSISSRWEPGFGQRLSRTENQWLIPFNSTSAGLIWTAVATGLSYHGGTGLWPVRRQPGTAPMIECRNIWFGWHPRQQVIRGATLRLEPGMLGALVG